MLTYDIRVTKTPVKITIILVTHVTRMRQLNLKYK